VVPAAGGPGVPSGEGETVMWHRWILDLLVWYCKRQIRDSVLRTGRYKREGNDELVRRSIKAFVFWARLGMALSERPVRTMEVDCR
jgi:hypothetical protein